MSAAALRMRRHGFSGWAAAPGVVLAPIVLVPAVVNALTTTNVDGVWGNR